MKPVTQRIIDDAAMVIVTMRMRYLTVEGTLKTAVDFVSFDFNPTDFGRLLRRRRRERQCVERRQDDVGSIIL